MFHFSRPPANAIFHKRDPQLRQWTALGYTWFQLPRELVVVPSLCFLGAVDAPRGRRRRPTAPREPEAPEPPASGGTAPTNESLSPPIIPRRWTAPRCGSPVPDPALLGRCLRDERRPDRPALHRRQGAERALRAGGRLALAPLHLRREVPFLNVRRLDVTSGAGGPPMPRTGPDRSSLGDRRWARPGRAARRGVASWPASACAAGWPRTRPGSLPPVDDSWPTSRPLLLPRRADPDPGWRAGPVHVRDEPGGDRAVGPDGHWRPDASRADDLLLGRALRVA